MSGPGRTRRLAVVTARSQSTMAEEFIASPYVVAGLRAGGGSAGSRPVRAAAAVVVPHDDDPRAHRGARGAPYVGRSCVVVLTGGGSGEDADPARADQERDDDQDDAQQDLATHQRDNAPDADQH